MRNGIKLTAYTGSITLSKLMFCSDTMSKHLGGNHSSGHFMKFRRMYQDSGGNVTWHHEGQPREPVVFLVDERVGCKVWLR